MLQVELLRVIPGSSNNFALLLMLQLEFLPIYLAVVENFIYYTIKLEFLFHNCTSKVAPGKSETEISQDSLSFNFLTLSFAFLNIVVKQ